VACADSLSRDETPSRQRVDQRRTSGALGDRGAAFADLDRAIAVHSSFLAYARVDPMLDPLRGDSRFEAVLQRLNLR
jgi:hypothetical protein